MPSSTLFNHQFFPASHLWLLSGIPNPHWSLLNTTLFNFSNTCLTKPCKFPENIASPVALLRGDHCFPCITPCISVHPLALQSHLHPLIISPIVNTAPLSHISCSSWFICQKQSRVWDFTIPPCLQVTWMLAGDMRLMSQRQRALLITAIVVARVSYFLVDSPTPNSPRWQKEGKVR